MFRSKYGRIIIFLSIFSAGTAFLLTSFAERRAYHNKKAPAGEAGMAPKGERRILFYRNPMNPSMTSEVPMKDPMGMDYIPVYADEGEPDAGGDDVIGNLRLSPSEIALSGVETAPAARLHLFKEIRTVGKVAYDPKLAIAQEEFLSALESRNRIIQGNLKELSRRADDLAESSRRKLRLLGMSEDEIKELVESGKVQGFLVLPEDKVWVYADVYEFELGWVKVGHTAKVYSAAFPGEEFIGEVKSINPTLDPKTRSARVRILFDNPDLKLKPDMYVDVVIESAYEAPEDGHMTIAVPKEAVLDTGTRKIVWVDKGDGDFEGRSVDVGPESSAYADGGIRRYFPILKGLREGDKVVTKANFLIDSQSQLSGAGAAGAYGGALGTDEKKAK